MVSHGTVSVKDLGNNTIQVIILSVMEEYLQYSAY